MTPRCDDQNHVRCRSVVGVGDACLLAGTCSPARSLEPLARTRREFSSRHVAACLGLAPTAKRMPEDEAPDRTEDAAERDEN